MNPEDLCKQIKEQTQKTDDKLTSHEYLQKYNGTKQFSVRKFLRLAEEERRQRNESKRLYYGGK